MVERDPLIVWARQDDRPGTRVWSAGDAIAVAVPALSRRNRLVVAGEPGAVAALLPGVLAETGPTYTPMGDEALINAVVERVDGFEVRGRWVWLDTTTPAPGPELGEWLSGEEEVAGFVAEVFPDSYAQPGAPGVRRWAGVRDPHLVAVAAEAWSAPGLGFMAGVATHPGSRGRGLAGGLCAFVTNELLRDNQRVALFADWWNEAALRTYRRLGFAQRPLAAISPRGAALPAPG